jgi:peptidyl-prolyl cis-trans isomerase B (cyclophilin B)
MARKADPDSAGSQWYVCLSALPSLDRKYTVFGRVFEGLDVCAAVQKGDRMLDVTVDHVARETVPAEAWP